MRSPTLDYFVVLKDTPNLKAGMALPKVTIISQTYYGLDKRNNFYTEKFLRNHPETFEHAGDKAQEASERAALNRIRNLG